MGHPPTRMRRIMTEERSSLRLGIAMVALSTICVCGCKTWQSSGKSSDNLPLTSQTQPPQRMPCVLDSIPSGSQWFDADAEVRIRFLDNGLAEYWLDGHRDDPTCCWRLNHLRHENGRCVFQCESPRAEWFVSICSPPNGHKTLKLEKNAVGRNLPLSYEFTQSPKERK